MWFDPLFQNKVVQDIVATVVTLALCLLWLRGMDALAHGGLIEQRLSRKIIHIGTGPLFVLCWNLFSAQPWARWCAALVPAAITLQFFLVGIGVMKDEAAVKAMTRHNDPREILKGPLYYGVVFVVCTLVFWRLSPVGLLALMLMCGGDGLADVVGRRWGKVKLPLGGEKSWAGSLAMLVGGFVFGFGFVALFSWLGVFTRPVSLGSAAGRVGIIALAGAVVEALPIPDVDNITTTAVAIGLGLLLF